MARRNFGWTLSTSMAGLITGALGVDTIVMVTQATVIEGEAEATITLDWTDASNSDTAIQLVGAATVAVGDAIAPMSAPHLLEPGDVLRARASASGDIAISGWVEELAE
jgi:hypothetical protein